MTARRSARRSASSMKCVVSRIVLPSARSVFRPVPDQVARLRVEAGGRLVHEDHVGIVDQRAGERQPPLHAARQLADARVGLDRQARELEQRRDARADRRVRRARSSGRRPAGSRATVKSGSRLSICGTTPTRMRASRPLRGTGRPPSRMLPASGAVSPRQQPQRGGLARAVRSEQARSIRRARIRQVEAAHDLVPLVAVAERLAEPADLDHVAARRPAWSLRSSNRFHGSDSTTALGRSERR